MKKSRHKRTNIVWFHLREIPRIGKFRKTNQLEVARDPGVLGMIIA